MASRARRIALVLHLWTGLAFGAWFALLGLTGSALVFYVELDRALDPQVRLARSVQAAPSPGAIEHALRAAFPGRDGPWRIELPLAPDMPVTARYYRPAERAGRHFAPLLATLDPETLAVTGTRFWGDTPMTWLFDLHYTLLLGKTGLLLVGLTGCASAALLVSGLCLWWPSRARLRAALRIVPRPGLVRRTYDLHNAGGIYAFAVLLVLALTGSALAFPDGARALVAPGTCLPSPRARPHGPAASSLPLDEAVAIARRRFPGARVRWIETSGARGTPVSVRLHQPGEPSLRFPQTRIWIDPADGAVLALHDPRGSAAAARLLDWMHPLHNGEAFGLGGRLLVLAAGFAPLLLYATGIYRWRQKIGARQRAALQARPPSAATPDDPAPVRHR